MPNTHNTKNFFAHGGNELVIGGKLTFLEDATTEGMGAVLPKMENMADSTATSVAELKTAFNTLLAALKEAGYMEPGPEPEPEDDEEDDDGENGNGGDVGGDGENGAGDDAGGGGA